MFDGSPKPLKTQKAPQQIINTIRRGILTGELKPGEKLPSEHDLMSHFGVSRQTMREALRALEAFGLLTIKVGSCGGAFVSEVDSKTAQIALSNFFFGKISLQQIFHVRQAIEPYAVRLACEKLAEKDEMLTKILADNIAECKKSLELKDFAKLRELEIEYHHHLVNAASCNIFTLVHDFVQSVLLEVKNAIKTNAEFSTRVIASHERILHHLQERNAEDAASEISKHLSIVVTELKKIENCESLMQWN